MKIARLAISIGASVFCLLPTGAVAESDAALRSKLVGTWVELRLVENDRHEQRMTLARDGTFEVKGVLHEGRTTTPFVWRGKWQVSKGKLVYRTTFSDPARIYPVGEAFEDAIVSVTDSEWVMIEQSTGNKSRARRVK